MREFRTAQKSIFENYSKHEKGQQLQKISDKLDKYPHYIGLVAQDVIPEGLKEVGCKGLSVESIFRCMILKQLYNHSYAALAFHLEDSDSYRTFARLDVNSFPSKSTLQSTIRKISPDTLENIFRDHVTKALNEGLVDLSKQRIDSTAIASNILTPSDSQLLDDCVRVLSRHMKKSVSLAGFKVRFYDLRKTSKKLAFKIFYSKKAEKKKYYKRLLDICRTLQEQIQRAMGGSMDYKTDEANEWRGIMHHYSSLLERVMDQTVKRVFENKKVPATEKIVSIFESHTDIISKKNRPTVFGHKINLGTDSEGVITYFNIEEGNPSDSECYSSILSGYKALFDCSPETLVSDGGYASKDNVKEGKKAGVKKVVFHKTKGIPLSEMGIKAKTLVKLRNFRAGVEGNISELKRVFGLYRVLWKGKEGFNACVWASVITYNLVKFAKLG